jgi:NADH dehydrogenase
MAGRTPLPYHDVVVVGAGFAGMYAALEMRPLAEAGRRIAVVNEENFMQYQPFLPEVASGTIDPRAVVVPLRQALPHVDLEVGEVVAIDHPSRRLHVRAPDGSVLDLNYGVLVVTAGSWSRVLPIPGLAAHGVGFKTIQEAIYLRNRVLSRLDVAAETDDETRRRAALTFVVVGAGYAGVEALGELEDLARDAIAVYDHLAPSDMRWVLIDVADKILPELGPDLAGYGARLLAARGIDIRTRTGLESYEDGVAVLSDGSSIAAETLVWTAGVRPSGLARRSGFPVDEAGRVVADEYLRVPGLEDVWAAGDAASVPDRTTGGRMPPTAQHGLRQGRHLARNLSAWLEGGLVRPFVYRNIGAVCSLGRYKGIANVMGVKLRGFPAWFAHRSYHLYAMPTLRRKAKIAADWTVALLFPRDLAQLGSLQDPRGPFERAAEG